MRRGTGGGRRGGEEGEHEGRPGTLDGEDGRQFISTCYFWMREFRSWLGLRGEGGRIGRGEEGGEEGGLHSPSRVGDQTRKMSAREVQQRTWHGMRAAVHIDIALVSVAAVSLGNRGAGEGEMPRTRSQEWRGHSGHGLGFSSRLPAGRQALTLPVGGQPFVPRRLIPRRLGERRLEL